MKKKYLALIAFVLCLSLCGCSTTYETYTLLPNQYFDGTASTQTDDSYKIGSKDQLTETDIQNMNQGNARMVYNKQGYLVFLNGRYSDLVVKDYEDAVATIQPMASLLGLSAGSEFFASFATRDKQGYTYYTFQQRYGDLTILYATLKVIVDPDGYTAGLTCSFTPNIGIYHPEKEITPEEAVAILDETFTYGDGQKLHYYTDHIEKMAVTVDGQTYSAYSIYADNPFDSPDFGMPYYQFFVTVTGEVLPEYYPVVHLATDNKEYLSESYFEGLETKYYTYYCNRYDGSEEEITIPVSYNPRDGQYYLMDPERKIAVADFSAFSTRRDLDFIHADSTLGENWLSYVLLAYARVIEAYDFYADYGLYSVDGTGVPILVCVGMEQDNACYFGINNGWGCIAFSPKNRYWEAMDVVGHEFTHGITSNAMIDNRYLGVTGAINEAYSDIMGNLMELMLEMTDDRDWLCGEQCGNPIRSMSNPRLYGQPIAINDPYYADPNDVAYDNGGVHRNSSLISMMAYALEDAGMTYEEQCSMWLRSIEILTPLAEYEEVYESLIMSLEINGFDERFKIVLTRAFENAGMLE